MRPDASDDPDRTGTGVAAGAAKNATSGSRADHIIERICAIPEGFVRTYGDIEPRAPRLVGRVLAAHHMGGEPPDGAGIPWQRVVRADGSVPGGPAQLTLVRREGVAMRGDRVDMRHARMPIDRDNARPGSAR